MVPTIHTLTDVSEWVTGGYSTMGLWLNYLAFVPIPALFVGLYSLQRPRIHALGLVGALAYGFAFVYFAHTTLFALATRTRNYHQLWEQMGWLYTFHGGLMIAGGVAFGVATARAGVLPPWTACAFLSGLGLNLRSHCFRSRKYSRPSGAAFAISVLPAWDGRPFGPVVKSLADLATPRCSKSRCRIRRAISEYLRRGHLESARPAQSIW